METEQGRRWAIATLKADAQVAALVGAHVYRGGEVQGDPDLYLAVSDVTSVDVSVLPDVIIQVNVGVQVTAWGRNQGRTRLETLMNRVQAALHAKSGSTATAEIFRSGRGRIVPNVPLTDEEKAEGFDRLDVEYALIVQEAVAA